MAGHALRDVREVQGKPSLIGAHIQRPPTRREHPRPTPSRPCNSHADPETPLSSALHSHRSETSARSTGTVLKSAVSLDQRHIAALATAPTFPPIRESSDQVFPESSPDSSGSAEPKRFSPEPPAESSPFVSSCTITSSPYLSTTSPGISSASLKHKRNESLFSSFEFSSGTRLSIASERRLAQQLQPLRLADRLSRYHSQCNLRTWAKERCSQQHSAIVRHRQQRRGLTLPAGAKVRATPHPTRRPTRALHAAGQLHVG